MAMFYLPDIFKPTSSMILHKNKFILPAIVMAAMVCSRSVMGQNSGYRRPPANVAAIVEAKPTPQVSMSPTRDALLLTYYNPNPSIATMAEPFLKLGGLRVNPQNNARQRITGYIACTVQWILDGQSTKIILPTVGQLAGLPIWSPNGKRLAFAVDVANGVQLWVADARSGKSQRVSNLLINNILSSAFSWLEDSECIMVRSI